MEEFFLTDKGRSYLESLRDKFLEEGQFATRESEDFAILGWLDMDYTIPPVNLERLKEVLGRLYEAGYIDA